MLSWSEVQAMTDVETESLPAMCMIQRASSSDDPSGGRAKSYTEDPTPVRCDVTPATQEEEIYGDREVTTGEYVITLPAGNRLKADDRIRLLPGPLIESDIIYEIIAPGVGDPYETAVEMVGRLVD
jgi:hypothetical protein